MIFSRRPFFFGIIGAVGFIADATAFSGLFYVFGFGHYTSRSAAFLLAVSLTWALNRTYTFRATASTNKVREYWRYMGVQTLGALINMVIYGVCIESSRMFYELPVLALMLGSITAMFFNYTGAYRFVYYGNRRE